MTTSPSPFLGAFLNRLGKVKRSGDGWIAQCPAHDDSKPSLSVTEADGKLLLKCHAACATDKITAAMGLTMADLFNDNRESAILQFQPKRAAPKQTLVAIYQYIDLATGAVAEKGRFELDEVGTDGKHKKTFLWRWAGADTWSGGVQTASLSLWGAEYLSNAPRDALIYFCEGEKATEACRDQGLLAVTHAGGASTKDFGVSLEVLRDRKVVLWPDNDAPGREYTATLDARLRGVAKHISIINVPVPPHGDAVEYFQSGGTVAALESGAIPLSGPSVELLPDDALGVRTSTPLGMVSMVLEQIDTRSRTFQAKASITVTGPGLPTEPYTEDIDFNSNSQTDRLRLSLDKLYGKDFNWTRLLNTMINVARHHYETYDRSIDAFDIVALNETELFFHNPLIPMNHITIFFGDRGSTKSYEAYDIAFCASIGEPFLGYTMPLVPTYVIDYEDNERNFRRRINRLAEAKGMALLPGMIHYLHVMGTPVIDLITSIRRKVVQDGIGLVIVDSLGPAVGGKPEDAKLAIDTMQALRRLGVTVIALAHVPKNHGEQPKDPFGSGFYSNLSRRTWYVERVQEEASDDIDVGLFCKKVNDGPLPRPIALRIKFEGLNGPVHIQQGTMADVPLLQEQRDLKFRLWDALETRTATVGQLVALVNADIKDVQNTIGRNPKWFAPAGEQKGDKGRPAVLWGRTAQQAQ